MISVAGRQWCWIFHVWKGFQTHVCLCFFRPWLTLSSWRSLRMPGRCVQRLSLKGFTSEFLLKLNKLFVTCPKNKFLAVFFMDCFGCVLIYFICLLFQWWPCEVFLLPSFGTSDQVQVRRKNPVQYLLCRNADLFYLTELCCWSCYRHAGLTAVQQHLIRETLMKWLQCQVQYHMICCTKHVKTQEWSFKILFISWETLWKLTEQLWKKHNISCIALWEVLWAIYTWKLTYIQTHI